MAIMVALGPSDLLEKIRGDKNEDLAMAGSVGWYGSVMRMR